MRRAGGRGLDSRVKGRPYAARWVSPMICNRPGLAVYMMMGNAYLCTCGGVPLDMGAEGGNLA